MKHYANIKPSGGDTGTPINLMKRIKLIQQYDSMQGKVILDCGCGTGQYVSALLTLGVDVYGIECSADKVMAFRQSHPEMAARISIGSIEQMNFADDCFDAILVNEVLEHVTNEARALEEIRRVLKPLGLCFIFSPNRLYPFETHGVTLKIGQKPLPHFFPLIPYVPIKLGNLMFDYRARNYWPHEMRKLLRRHDFAIIHTGYVWQTFENISGHQPSFIVKTRPALRKIALLLEHMPVIRAFGVSQFLVVSKRTGSSV